MTLTVETTDSLYSHTMLSTLLDYLNEYLMTMVQHEAAENEAYLEQRLITVADPLLREKIQTLIANEVEKQMLVSKEAFSVLDPPFTARTFREKKLYPLVFGFGLFFVTTLLVVFGHALTSADKTEEDKRLIEGIKRELWMGRR